MNPFEWPIDFSKDEFVCIGDKSVTGMTGMNEDYRKYAVSMNNIEPLLDSLVQKGIKIPDSRGFVENINPCSDSATIHDLQRRNEILKDQIKALEAELEKVRKDQNEDIVIFPYRTNALVAMQEAATQFWTELDRGNLYGIQKKVKNFLLEKNLSKRTSEQAAIIIKPDGVALPGQPNVPTESQKHTDGT